MPQEQEVCGPTWYSIFAMILQSHHLFNSSMRQHATPFRNEGQSADTSYAHHAVMLSETNCQCKGGLQYKLKSPLVGGTCFSGYSRLIWQTALRA